MTRATEALVERIRTAQNLDAARAYADAIQIIERQDKLVSVVLECRGGSDYRFISVIKEVRQIFNLGLLEAKNLVEAGHTWQDMPLPDAETLRTRLAKAGGKVQVV
jgi:ribosomal protein L7/L12